MTPYYVHRVDAARWPPEIVRMLVVEKHHHWYGVIINGQYREVLLGRLWHRDEEQAWNDAMPEIERVMATCLMGQGSR